MGKLTGAQHLMKAAGVDPENPIGSLLEKAGVNPQEILTVAHAIPELLKAFEARQQRMENGLAEIAANQQRIIALLENRPRLNAGTPDGVFDVPDDVTQVLDAFERRGLGESNQDFLSRQPTAV